MYRILGGDGKEYGPISTDTVKQWLTEGRLGPLSQVRLEGDSTWKVLSDFPELMGRVRPSASLPAPPQTSNSAAQFPRARTSGLAVTSVVLGALGCAGFTAIGGLVCGIIALGKINKSEGRQKGRGLAITGIVLSSVMLVLSLLFTAVIVGRVIPAASRSRRPVRVVTSPQSSDCINNMKQLGLGLRMYSLDHNTTFPPDLLSMSNELGSPILLVCPDDPARARPTSSSWEGITTNQISYEYLTPGATESSLSGKVVVRCPIHGHTCLSDGAVLRGNQPSPVSRRPR